MVKYFLGIFLVVLAGCSTRVPIQSTLSTAQEQCDQLKALITNKAGVEAVTIKCTWEEVDRGWIESSEVN